MTTVQINEGDLDPTYAQIPNVELLKAALRRIEAHPEQFDQWSYRSPEGGCFGFHTAMVVYRDAPPWADPAEPHNDDLVADADDPPEYVSGGRIPLGYRAQRLLGLTEQQRMRLFSGHNSLHDLRRIVGDLTGDGAR